MPGSNVINGDVLQLVFKRLTGRERAIAALVDGGKSSREISAVFAVSRRSTEAHPLREDRGHENKTRRHRSSGHSVV